VRLVIFFSTPSLFSFTTLAQSHLKKSYTVSNEFNNNNNNNAQVFITWFYKLEYLFGFIETVVSNPRKKIRKRKLS